MLSSILKKKKNCINIFFFKNGRLAKQFENKSKIAIFPKNIIPANSTREASYLISAKNARALSVKHNNTSRNLNESTLVSFSLPSKQKKKKNGISKTTTAKSRRILSRHNCHQLRPPHPLAPWAHPPAQPIIRPICTRIPRPPNLVLRSQILRVPNPRPVRHRSQNRVRAHRLQQM